MKKRNKGNEFASYFLFLFLKRSVFRLYYQPLFGKRTRAPALKSLFSGMTRESGEISAIWFYDPVLIKENPLLLAKSAKIA